MVVLENPKPRHNTLELPVVSEPDVHSKSLLSRYEFCQDEIIALGASSLVHKARDSITDRWVALKVAKSEAFRASFTIEAAALETMCHPNIPELLDSCFGPTEPLCLVTALAGRSLGDTIRNSYKTMEPAAVIRIGVQIASALGHAHSKGILHNDVKPDNILDSGGNFKLFDWGTALFQDSRKSDRSFVWQGDGECTLGYASPETIRSEALGPSADFFSLTLVLAVALTGSNPIKEYDPETRLLRMQKGPDLTALVKRSDLNQSSIDFFRKGLAFNPEERHQSADEFIVDLIGHL